MRAQDRAVGGGKPLEALEVGGSGVRLEELGSGVGGWGLGVGFWPGGQARFESGTWFRVQGLWFRVEGLGLGV